MEKNLIPWNETYQDVKPVSEIHIVDDDKDMRDLLEGALAADGFPVKSFEEGDSFLTATSSAVPICVFLDVVLPGRSGLEILQDLRARRHWTPVILMSGRRDVPTVVEAIKTGANDYIAKPFDPCELLPRVHNAIDMWLRRPEVGETRDIWANESTEWFRLTPGEKEMLLLMRLMNT